MDAGMSAPGHAWFLPGLRIEHAASEAERLELFRALGRAGRLESLLYDAPPRDRGLAQAWRTLTDGAWVFALRYPADEAAPDLPGASGPDLSAVVVLNGFTGQAAFFHCCLLPGFERHWLALGRDIISWLFESGRLECFMGFTPACYRHVLAGLPGFGFVPQFAAPRACFIRRRHRYADGVVSLCTRKSFEEAVNEARGGGTFLKKGLLPRTPTPKDF